MNNILNINKDTTQDDINQFFKENGLTITQFIYKYIINYDFSKTPSITIEYKFFNSDMFCQIALFDIKLDGTESLCYNNDLIIKIKTNNQQQYYYTDGSMVENIMEDVGV